MQTIVALLDHHNSRAEIVANQMTIILQLSELGRLILANKPGITPEQSAEIIALNATQQQKVDFLAGPLLAADPK